MNRNFNKRNWQIHSMTPMRVTDAVISECRSLVEPSLKGNFRRIILPFILKRFQLSEVGEGFQWGSKESIKGSRFGRYASIGNGGKFSGPVVIGDLTMISTDLQVIGNDHVFTDPDKPMRYNFPEVDRPVTVIEADCWIGARVTIMEGVRISRGSIVAAGSIVTKDIAPYSVVAGQPARLIKIRFDKKLQDACDLKLYGKLMTDAKNE